MIRRDDRGDWLIIEQVEHARLVGELANAWGNERVAPLAAYPGLVWGIEHHDDGWSAWDAAPAVHPETGIPRSFLEMRMCDSTAIWTRSIAVCSAHPLAGIGVSRHFCYLARQAGEREWASADDREAIDRFLRGQSIVHADLAATEREQASAALTPQTGEDLERSFELAYHAVQFF